MVQRVTIADVNKLWQVTDTYDLLNRIRNSASPQYQNYVPLANKDNIAEVGAGIMLLSTTQNEFITALVERIGKVVIRSTILNNPLKFFKKGNMPQGRTIEEIFVDISKEHVYDPEAAEKEVFKREIPDVKAIFHEVNRKGFYKQSIQENSLQQAFLSWESMDTFISKIINSMYNSNEVDEFNYMKLLVDNYDSKGLFTVVPVDPITDEASGKRFVKAVKMYSNRLTFASRNYNAMAVMTKTAKNDQYLIMTSDAEANVQVDVLASAFNMDMVNFAGRYTLVDEFGNPDIQGVLIDRDWYMVYDTLFKMEVQRNGQGLYSNYFLHIWQILSTSRFANAIVFKSGTLDPVTRVIVDPPLASIKTDRKMTLHAYVRSTDKTKHDVVWSVERADGEELQAGTSINQDGELTVGVGEYNEESLTNALTIKATVTLAGEPAKTVVGQATVTVTQEG